MATSWHILGVLGSGGFGRVYLARRTGPHGYAREVAVKLLSPERADDSMLRRFRDEARILALVRDRAVVAAEPPVKLGERWAIVMEYVAGRSLQELLDAGHEPPRAAALELVEEVARALAHMQEARSAEGVPLELVHRDLKPANLQLTRAGEVKILDFGIARANLPDREASTTRAVVGTPGYLAPERMLGQDGPAGDVYALGVLLGKLVGCFERQAEATLDPALVSPTSVQPVSAAVQSDAIGELARVMTAYAPGDRPTAREVERRARALRAAVHGASLREWCERVVPLQRELADDELCGTVLEEVTPGDAEVAAPPRRGGLWIAGLAVLAVGTWGGLGGREEASVTPAVEGPAVEPGVAPAEVPPTEAPPTEVPRTEVAPKEVAPKEVAPKEVAPPVPLATASAPPAAGAPPADRGVTPPRAPAAVEPRPAEPPAAPVTPPEPARAPEPAPADLGVRVDLRGDASSVVLVRGGRRVTLPASVAPGSWKVEVTFPGREAFVLPQAVVVEADRPITVRCSLRLNGCTAGP
jgi:hypothetical protein